MSYQDRPPVGRPSTSEMIGTMPHTERILFWIALINFATFAVIGFFLGGAALNGKQLDGHYFLGSHGHFHEVGRAVYVYSLLHASSQFITIPLGMIAMWSARAKSSEEDSAES